MPRYFAARRLNLDGRQIELGDELPEAATWKGIDAWVSRGAIVVSLDPNEVVATLKLTGGSPDWLRQQSVQLFADVQAALVGGVISAEQAAAVLGDAEQDVDAPDIDVASARPEPTDEPTEGSEGVAEEKAAEFDPGEHTVAAAIEWADAEGRTEDELYAALDAEEAGKGRVTLIDHLTALLSSE